MDGLSFRPKRDRIESDVQIFRLFDIKLNDHNLAELCESEQLSNESLKLVNPFLKNFFQELCLTCFKNDPKLVNMYLRHHFIVVDKHDPLITDSIYDIDILFEKKPKIEVEKVYRKNQCLMSCIIDLNEFDLTKTNHYYFFFIIDRNIISPKLMFLGYLYNPEENNLKDQKIFIEYLVRSPNEIIEHTDLSKTKKEKKHYRKKALLLSFPEDNFTF